MTHIRVRVVYLAPRELLTGLRPHSPKRCHAAAVHTPTCCTSRGENMFLSSLTWISYSKISCYFSILCDAILHVVLYCWTEYTFNLIFIYTFICIIVLFPQLLTRKEILLLHTLKTKHIVTRCTFGQSLYPLDVHPFQHNLFKCLFYLLSLCYLMLVYESFPHRCIVIVYCTGVSLTVNQLTFEF